MTTVVMTSGEVPLAIVSTLDGSLHALEIQTGRVVWSLEASELSEAPLLSSSLHNIQIEDSEDGHVRIIPSLSGDLFKWTGQKLEQYPTSADVLLSTSTKLTEDTVAVGAISFKTTGVRAVSGNVAYRCSGSEPCVRQDADTIEAGGDLLLVRNTRRTVRAVDEFTGQERWNFSVVDVDITYSASPRSGFVAYYTPTPPIDSLNADTPNIRPSGSVGADNSCQSNIHIKVMTPEGAIFGVAPESDSSSHGEIVW
jgi:outer membrane protein assembly factor BamB